MRITVIGAGYVGLTAGVCFAEAGHSAVCLDIDENKINKLQKGVSPIYEEGIEDLIKKNMQAGRLTFSSAYGEACRDADAIFIAVATPQQPDGSACLKSLYRATGQVAQNINQKTLVVIKSTVPPGTGDEIENFMDASTNLQVELASNPEFLTQGSAVAGMMQADRIVIGTKSKWAEGVLQEIYKPFDLPIVSVSRRSAEMIKYACNNFLALKISYINEIANLCELVGADIRDVALGMSLDGRIGSHFLNAGIGFGGSCLPKDSAALEHLALKSGCELKTVRAAMDVNQCQKTILLRKAANRIPSFENVRTAVLGLTFKPRTDDLREAPSIENVAQLLEMGADIMAYDPVGMENFKKILAEGRHKKGSIAYAKSARDALAKADICFVFTEWDEFGALEPGDFKQFMKTPVVFDGRNIYNIGDMKKSGVEYYSIGRSD